MNNYQEELRQLTILSSYLLRNNKKKKRKFSTILRKRIIKLIFRRHIPQNVYPNVFHSNNFYPKITNEEMKKISTQKKVIYTCVTGKYDSIHDPVFYDPTFDYILYTDNPDSIKSKIWQVRRLPRTAEKINNFILQNRYIKLHPYELFDDYDFSVYIDANVVLTGDISGYLLQAYSKTGLAIHRHSRRDSVYEEAAACIQLAKGKPRRLLAQCKKYKSEKFPEHYGLLECNVLVTDLTNKNGEKIYDQWWKDFIFQQSYRDQMSLPYILWKMGYNIDDVGNLGENVFMDGCFLVVNGH